MQGILFRILLFLCLPLLASAQEPLLGKWWVVFTDKADSPYCICRPTEYLSARALERRARASIAIVENDLPVNPKYVKGLRDQGVRIHHTSKWLNAATVIADSASAQSLRQLPYVKTIEYLGRDISIQNPANRPAKKRRPTLNVPKVEDPANTFGYSALQNSMLGIPLLHAAGFRGKGVWIAVMDGGFTNADTLAFFDSLALQGRLYQGWDFVEGDQAVFESAMHGTSVLSVMASNLSNYFVGTAPDATYFLLKTEDTGGEFPVEEANWIAGAEWADSLGVDIINASLGYTTFNDPALNHRFSQLDGHSTIGSRGASIAATKGMIICNSAGNSGDEPWKYLGVPADAPGIVAVGAVQHDGAISSFSSVGPTADGRIKPDLVAPGETVVVAGNTGTDLGLSNGTSLAAPMLAGALASLWSAFPEKTAAEILTTAVTSADQCTNPDNQRGYGMPNMAMAWLKSKGYLRGSTPNDAGSGFFAYSWESGSLSFLLFESFGEKPSSLIVRDIWGHQVETGPYRWKPTLLPVLTISGLQNLPPGPYTVELVSTSGLTRLMGLVWQ